MDILNPYMVSFTGSVEEIAALNRLFRRKELFGLQRWKLRHYWNRQLSENKLIKMTIQDDVDNDTYEDEDMLPNKI